MSDQPQQVQAPTAQPNHHAKPAAAARPAQAPAPPQVPAAERVRLAAQRRDETDFIFRYWPALGWTILTLGIYGFYVFYQLIRRMRDHNAGRLELLDAATTVAWEQAGRQGLQQEMARSFERPRQPPHLPAGVSPNYYLGPGSRREIADAGTASSARPAALFSALVTMPSARSA